MFKCFAQAMCAGKRKKKIQQSVRSATAQLDWNVELIKRGAWIRHSGAEQALHGHPCLPPASLQPPYSQLRHPPNQPLWKEILGDTHTQKYQALILHET